MLLPGQEQLLDHTTLFGSHWIVAERSSRVCHPHWVGVAKAEAGPFWTWEREVADGG